MAPAQTQEVALDFKSVLAGGQHRGAELTRVEYPRVLAQYPIKFYWFASKGYLPHAFQAVFHGATTDGKLTRFRHLVAGRRGGKTLSAAWEVLFYALHPQQFHLDAHGEESDRPLWIWALAKNYTLGFPSLATFLQVMGQAGLVKGKDYEYNKTERRIEFENGSVIQFKTADDPQSLRGASLDILWIDEAAFIETDDAYIVTYPALTDRQGLVISTTTPHGKNWFYEEFFTGEALDDPQEFRVQYTSIDNPFFPREDWERAKRRYHPIHFKQEFLAAFDAFHGIALQGDWLKYWVTGNPDMRTEDVSLKRFLTDDGRYRLRIFMGVDPAASLSDNADHFAMAVVGVTDDNAQAFLLDTFLGRLPFPDQLDKIEEWQVKWRPQIIGVESNAYQTVLAQQAARLATFPNVVPVFSGSTKNGRASKKVDRILAMGPVFKTGRVRVHRRHSDFIDQWVAFDPEKKNQKDDLLDAVELALSAVGILLPITPLAAEVERRSSNPNSIAREQIRAMKRRRNRPYDPDLGSEA